MRGPKDGGPAFAFSVPELFTAAHEGMSLRDWFAGQALVMLPHMGCGADLDTHDTAMAAYQIADAMLAAREVKP